MLGYVDGAPVAWCAVAPRGDYPGLARSRILKPVDETPVWSVSCLFVDRRHRKKGFSVQMLRGAVAHVHHGDRVAAGAVEDDVQLMRRCSPPRVKVKAAGGVRNFERVLVMRALGASRIGVSATKTILDECKAYLQAH